MVHMLFLLTGLGLACAGQMALLAGLRKSDSWGLRRALAVWGLAMPLSAILLFGVAMLPEFSEPSFQSQSNHAMNLSSSSVQLLTHTTSPEKDIALTGFWLLSISVVIALVISILQVVWLYYRTIKHTWQAPIGLSTLLYEKSLAKNKSKIQVRLWASSRAFAFNLPALRPNGQALIVISTEMVKVLETSQLQAVLWHEQMHLDRRDFQWLWLALWLRNAFWYLPGGWLLRQQLQADKELACDERVAGAGGLSLTVALTEALLRVWEATLHHKKLSFYHFEAPGLLESTQPLEPDIGKMSLLEQRVLRLLELGETDRLSQEVPVSLKHRLKAGSLLSGSVGLWLVSLELMHLLMLPLGCAFTFGLFF
jgi:beta-lactamase regulating signal transducer with metallopeptidase domain